MTDRYKAFISYAWRDNQPFGDSEKGWVSTFVDGLRKHLDRELHRAVAKDPIWLDYEKMRGHHNIAEHIRTKLEASRQPRQHPAPVGRRHRRHPGVYQGHTAGLWSVARHGDTLFTASDDQTVGRWSLATPGQWVWELRQGDLFEAHDGNEVISVSFSESGELLLTQSDWGLRLWDLTKQPPEPRNIAKDMLLWATLRPDS